MDPALNQFALDSGAKPPALVGRQPAIDAFDLLVAPAKANTAGDRAALGDVEQVNVRSYRVLHTDHGHTRPTKKPISASRKSDEPRRQKKAKGAKTCHK
jgi:hypothetical protein